MSINSLLKKYTPGTWLVILFLTGLLLRVAVSVLFADNHTLYFEYMTIAQNLLDGKGYSFDEWGRTILQPTSFLPPIYVFWCAFFMWLSPHHYIVLYIAQALVSASGVYPAFRVGSRMFSRRVGWVFAIAYTFYPEFMFVHSRPVSEFMYVVLALWILDLYLTLRERSPLLKNAWITAALAGGLGGITVLVKEGASVVLASVLLSLLIVKRPKFAVLKSYILPFVAGVILVMLPWMIRNTLVQGRFIPIRTGYGVTFWLANHPGGTGTDKTLNGEYILDHLPKDYDDYMNRSLPVDEQDRDVFYRAEGLRFIREHTGEYLTLTLKRLWYYVWFDPTNLLARNIIYRASYVLLLLFAIPGVIIAVRRRQLDPVLYLSYFGYLILYVPVLILPRYRIIPVLIFLLIASYAVANLWEWRRKKTTVPAS